MTLKSHKPRWRRSASELQLRQEKEKGFKSKVSLRVPFTRLKQKHKAYLINNYFLTELLEKDNFKRIFTAFAVFTAQQATGATAFAYYGPQYFKLLVGGGTRALLLTAIFGAVKVVACGIFVIFVSEKIGRRNVLIGGAAFMSACQITTAIVLKEIPAPESGHVTSSGIATVALIYLFVIAYNFSWGPLPWPYVSEYVLMSMMFE